MPEDKPDFRKIAAQLANPFGSEGVETANRMNESNGEMILHAIDLLEISEKNQVLELGPGNAKFAAEVLAKGDDVHYVGADISPVMIEEAKKINAAFMQQGSASFILLKEGILPFEDQCFHKIFTVNTLYFWEDPTSSLEELYRVLKPGGVLCIAIRSKKFMETLPFTKYGFSLYSPEEGVSLFEKSKFQKVGYSLLASEGETFTGEPVVKEEVFFLLQKIIDQ
ncbi:class I SAM-dependent methyltransferase [Olivibacter sp. SDN3]|uniref:class I SAM-dependent methyltransferase n=1 Tax=Olivibacter sp. SDN3 TaxID=2764720 RepID=UPI0016516C15|nr:class I SAM-dependent methyltransferase [Olivibacter sp. SDN3]QNL50423.1 class I SAM-dependent methyltransferase [Olivibacter sp. SDN3]